jgi:hypothetical protein
MTTKPPAPVKPHSGDTLETLAYASVAGIPTVEPHDQDRLGYCVWRWLSDRRDPLAVAVRSAGARLLIPEKEALDRIGAHLQTAGVTVDET